jgi:hypothetical protein
VILYVNGDSHTAGAELVHVNGRFLVFREDDSKEWAVIGEARGRDPHPECLKRSYGQLLANQIGAEFVCDAVSASSNARILRTTREYLKHSRPDYVIIGWSTWEREEWWHEGTERYWQVNGGGVGHDWPQEFKDRYKDYVANIDFTQCQQRCQQDIWQLHVDLNQLDIPHLFFNTFSHFDRVDRLIWGDAYYDPYWKDSTYFEWLRIRGFQPVNPDSFHYGPDAHQAWADFLAQNYFKNQLTQK